MMNTEKAFTCYGTGVKAPVRPVTRSELLQMRRDPKLATNCRLILEGDVKKKDELPVWTPHCAAYRNNHRHADNALIPLQRLMMDIDVKGHSQEILERALKLQRSGKWHVLLVEESVRKGTHVLVALPVGMTAEEVQKRFSEDIGFPVDSVVKDLARCIYLVPEDYVLYENEALFEPVEAVKPETSPVAVSSSPSPEVPVRSYPDNFKGIPYADIISEWFVRNGGKPATGERNNKLYTLAKHLRCITDNDEEFLFQVMPNYGLPVSEMKALIHSACSCKFRGMSRKMATLVNDLETDSSRTVKVTTMAGIYTADVPPAMPKKLPPLIELLVSRTPDSHRATVAQAVFPALGIHLWQTKFVYYDNVKHEPTLMNVLMAETGSGKSCIDKPIERILYPIRQRDRENIARENAWRREMQTKSQNKDRRERPNGLVVQIVSPDITNAALVQRMEDAEGRFLYMKMNEIQMLDGLKGYGGRNAQYMLICLAFDPDNEYGQDRVGVASVNAHVTFRLNWNACTTPNQGMAYFRNVLINGPVNRINFCTIPERPIGSPAPIYGEYDAGFDEELRPYLDRLGAARGVINCEEVKKFAEKLSKECAEIAVLTQDRVFENLSFRATVIAFLKACVLYVAHGYRWDRTMAEFVRWSLHYDLWVKMHYFGDAIARAEEALDTGIRKPGPKNLLDVLPDIFTRAEAHLMRQREGITTGSTQAMLDNWKHRKHIELYGEKQEDRNLQQYAKTKAYLKKFARR